MRLIKKSLMILLLVAFVVELQTGSFAWLTRPLKASMPNDFGGSTEVVFFESGDGSPETPYVISSAVHMYNLAWLQYLGYFNLGANVNNKRAQSFFVLKNDIDMEGLAIPPIGTEEFPFLGNFDGKGYTVINGITANASDLLPERPTAAKFRVNDLISAFASSTDDVARIIGFFGVIGDYNGAISKVQLNTNASTIGTISTDNISAKHFYLNTHSIMTRSSNTTIGIAAGYVNAEFVGVGVCDSSLDITSTGVTNLTSNKSDYTLVGYATDTAKTTLNVRTVKLSVPKTSTEEWVYEGDAGSGNAWGGSVDMISMFDRLQDIRYKTTGSNTYVYDRYIDVDVNGQSTVTSNVSGTTMYANTSDPLQGYFVFSSNNTQYTYLHGGTTIFETSYTLGEDTTAYLISNGNGNYLSVSGTSITNTTNSSSAAKWFFSDGINGGYVSTLTNNILYYLTVNNGSLTLSKTKDSTWQNTNGSLISGAYCLTYISSWQVSSSFKISDGNGNYLNLSGSNISNSTNANTAIVWSFTSVSGGWRISYQSGNTTYYLRYNNGLTTTTSQGNATTWTVNDGEIYYSGYYIRYNNGWQASRMTFYISDGNGNYLRLNGNQLQNTTSIAQATQWTFTSGHAGGQIFSGSSYLRYNNGLTIGSSWNGSTWTYSDNNLRTGTTTYNYLKFSNGSWSASANITTSATISVTKTTQYISLVPSASSLNYTPTTTKAVNVSSRVYVDTTGSNVTYFPLQVNDNNYKAAIKNTGYIISSSQDRTTSDTYPARSGDIRVSYYANTSTNRSIDATYINNASIVRINTVNDSGTQVNITNSTAYEKLEKAKENFSAVLKKNTQRLYGLHFMDAYVSKDNLITAPAAIVNGITYSNYQMPTDCIDFRLKEKGYINFFAGTYFPGNNSFFSLYDIFRDSNNNITDIKRIVEIYGHSSNQNYSYVYKYEDGTFSTAYQTVNNVKVPLQYTGNLPNGYISKFKTSWIEVNNIPEKALYYFEIPVNEGEYALGSTSGGTGSYLMYLDIGANAQTIERTIISERITTITDTHSYANGVGVVGNTQIQNQYVISNLDIIAYKLAANSSGILQISRSGNAVTISGIGGTTRYIADGMTVNGSSIPIPDNRIVRVEKRLTYIDYNVVTNETAITVISQIDNNTPTMIVYLPDGTTQTDPYRVTKLRTDSINDIYDYFDPSEETLLEFSFTVKESATVNIQFVADYEASKDYVITSINREMRITSTENTTVNIITQNFIEDSGTDPNHLSSTDIVVTVNGN